MPGFSKWIFLEQLEGLGVENADGGAEFVGDPIFLVVGGNEAAAWAISDQDLGDDLALPRIDHEYRVGDLGGDEHHLAVVTEAYAFGLDPHLLDYAHLLAGGDIGDGDLVVVLVGGDDDAARGVEVEYLGILAGLDGADDAERGDIDDIDAIVTADRDQQLAFVDRPPHVARSLAGGNRLDDLKTLSVDHRDGIIHLVADKYVPGARGIGAGGYH